MVKSFFSKKKINSQIQLILKKMISQELMTKFNIVKVQREVLEWHDKHKINPKPKENELLKEIYTFSDILENETKEEYFERSGLYDNLEYLIFLFKTFVHLESCNGLKNILPIEFGGSHEWLIEVKVYGERIIEIFTNFPFSIGSSFIIKTNLSKKEYFEKYPIDINYMRYVLDVGTCNTATRGRGGINSTRDLVPPVYDNLIKDSRDLDKWLDCSKANDELRKKYQEEGEGKKKQKLG
jgi:hypothetical protein